MSPTSRHSRYYIVAILLGYGLLSPQLASADSGEVTDSARAHFKEGVVELSSASPDYAKAYAAFRAAYSESASWKILSNLGIAAMHLERDGEALEAFQRYLREGGPTLEPQEIEQFESDIAMLETKIAWVNLSLPEQAKALLDVRVSPLGDRRNEYKLTGRTLRLGVRSGLHIFEVQLDDGSSQSWRVELEPGQKEHHDFSERENRAAAPMAGETSTPEDGGVTRPVPISVYVGLASTAAFAVAGGVTGGLALKSNNDFNELNDGSQPDEAEAARNEAKTLGLVSDIMWGSTVVAAGVTAVLYFTRPSQEPETASLRWTPVVGPNTWAVSVSGSF